MIVKILLLIFIVSVLIIALTAARIIGQLRDNIRRFRDVLDGQNGGGRQQRDANRHAYNSGKNARYHQNGQNVVVDHRDADVANQKIFKKDEGEYIDFEEEK